MAPPAHSRRAVALAVATLVLLAACSNGDTASDKASVAVRDLRPKQNGFYGRMFTPKTGRDRPAVLLFGGSNGGPGPVPAAQALAEEGYPALALAYFRVPGLPQELREIPLEYFVRALRWLRKQPRVDPDHVVTWGVSRGSEAALLLAAHYPDLVHGVIALVPGNVTLCAFPGCPAPAWTLRGKALPYVNHFGPFAIDDPDALIPVERTDGPILLICGEADKIWQSCPMSRAMLRRLRDNDHAFPDRLLAYKEAGHGVGVLGGAEITGTAPPRLLELLAGSTKEANDKARAKAWPEVLRFLSSLD